MTDALSMSSKSTDTDEGGEGLTRKTDGMVAKREDTDCSWAEA